MGWKSRIERTKLYVAAAAISLAMPLAHANCYAVYKGDARVYHAQTPPVDTSLPYSETVPARFGPGAMMVVTTGAFDCPMENEIQGGDALSGAAPSKEAQAAARDRALNRLAERHGGSAGDGSDSSEATSNYGTGGAYSRGPILTGPRGGQYYVNSSGNKTYVGSGGGRRR